MNIPNTASRAQIGLVRLMSTVMPGPFARVGAASFLKPRRLPQRELWTGAFDGSARHEVTVDTLTVPAWARGEGPTVFLIHGWERDHRAMGGFVRPLLAAGFRVVAPDLPAHGEAEGVYAPLPLLARAISALSRVFGQPQAVIAHSVGGAMSVLAAESYGLRPGRMILLGTPIGAANYAMAQGQSRGLAPASLGRMLEMISAELKEPLSRFRVDQGLRAVDAPGLLIHDKHDRIVPLADATANARLSGWTLVSVDTGGHNKMLGSDAVISHAVEFLKTG
ncbi:alpha/beta hydrolase [Ectothiorhodospiraceae bacterium WFHF3C12]|nr:alpha/beta hydrolase [Ectothiorhodospiraceae bacterium WFHF3C12]